MSKLLERIKSRQANVVVVGAGYVGLPLAVEVAQSGFPTVTYDKSTGKVEAVNRGESYIGDVPSKVLAPLVKEGRLQASADPDVLKTADAIIICVPTPLNKTKDPDNSFILDAADMIASRMRPGQLIVLESTTFPGFTREVLVPKLSSSGLEAGRDYFVAFSPERVDPGNPKFHTKNTPKVIGADSEEGLAAATALYASFIDTLVPVSNTDTAEMVKLLENTFRAVNIGLVNEVAIMCQHLGLNTWEVIEAAATKPFGFMPFFPGPGLGGHCIPIDPLYLSWKLKTLKYQARFIELADNINSGMPGFVVSRVTDALNDRNKSVRGSKVLVSGVSYKRDIDDVRESPAIDIIELLRKRGAEVSYYDPHVAAVNAETTHGALAQEVPAAALQDAGSFDCVLITTDHRAVDYAQLVANAQLVVDTRNATKALRQEHGHKIVSL
ncbi:MAG: nucleotide sugar dehydrogenase [Myxococcales bacterium]|nr:nucleotide sugar dehydrogenase [Myxococcales bacterium]